MRALSASMLATFAVLSFTVAPADAKWRYQGRPSRAEHAEPRPSARARLQTERLHAVLINGGGKPSSNYRSHFLHIRQIRALLLAAGVAPERITIFSSDGQDPGADLAVRASRPDDEGLWRLLGTPAWGALTPQTEFEDSRIEGATLEPATKNALSRWFESRSAKLGAGDVLLVYVTDHGNKNADDTTDNTITMWGEDLSVGQLSTMMSSLSPEVRVVMLMSQCFSGSFAHLIDSRAPEGRPVGSTCGYFASTEDRQAYGCYPENLGRENVGHSFRFFDNLSRTGGFETAHLETLVDDATPDVPLRTSDVYLERMLRDAAEREGVEYEAFVDRLLAQAWRDKARWEPEIRLLDRIGRAYGYFSPRSLAELNEQTRRLPDIAEQMRNVSQAWGGSLADSNKAAVDAFLEAEPEWSRRLLSARKDALDDARRDEMRESFLADLREFERARPAAELRLVELNERREDGAATAYRMEVRLAVVLRMRLLLTHVAGEVFLETRGGDAQRAEYRALRACEDVRIPATDGVIVELATPEPFPSFESDMESARETLPGWMGIRYANAETPLIEKLELPAGAARVVTVYPESPAARAGLQANDLILGPPGEPFEEPGRVRSWTMLSEIGQESRLEVLRDRERLTVALAPDPYPLKWPSLPGPPEPGTKAPPLELGSYRGQVETLVAKGPPYLLFFWATWCLPCKTAVPELLRFEEASGVPVIAVTDELAEQLDGFFDDGGEFPAHVAIDRARVNFLAYGVSGTPTFVYVDREGNVGAYSSGYAADTGLAEELRALMAKGG